MTIKFKLYSSDGCHLCEQALALCVEIIEPSTIDIVDIVEDESLVDKYGIHIPVLKRLVDNKELFWPFTNTQIQELSN